jgi:long-chain acyl-CoA synthetase
MGIDRYRKAIDQPELWLTELQRRWIRPRSAFARIGYTLLYVVNWVLVRLLFRVSVEGRRHLPVSGPMIITPNHASPLDPPVLATVIPLAMLQHTFWAGKQSTVLRNRLRYFLSWLTRVIPIREDPASLASAVTILQQGDNLVWFPEGERSLSGQMQDFKPGIAVLLTRCDVPVVPVFIQGAFDAFPSRKTLPRIRTKIVVRIGAPQSAQQLGLTSSSTADIHRAITTLRQRIAELGRN